MARAGPAPGSVSMVMIGAPTVRDLADLGEQLDDLALERAGNSTAAFAVSISTIV